MCEITCHLFRECSHHHRTLVLCKAKEAKRLKQYYQYRHRLEHPEKSAHAKRSIWSCFFSSSSEYDSIPRPLLRPATHFTYTTLEPPKTVTQYSCRASKIFQKTSTHWSACPNCSRRPANTNRSFHSQPKAPAARVPGNKSKPLPSLPRSQIPPNYYPRHQRSRPSRYY